MTKAGDPDRNETPTEQLDRNWGELLQELRVVQTGVQLLTGVLLTVPFQQRFRTASAEQHEIYLATVSAALAATILFQAPVSLHRILFRLHERRETVDLAHTMAMVGIVFLALALDGAAVLVFDLTAGPVAGAIAGGVCGLGLIGLWAAVPLAHRHGRRRRLR